MDTDYDNYAMICTCQVNISFASIELILEKQLLIKYYLFYKDMDLFFTYAHRLSCSIMQRQAEEDPAITKRMRDLVDSQVDDASHDFDKIKQAGCEYNKEKVLNIDVDKILGLKGDSGVSDQDSEYQHESKFTHRQSRWSWPVQNSFILS